MSDQFIARAPGKLFVLGEYAVLGGAPAVVAAIDRYIQITLTVNASTTTAHIVAPDLNSIAVFPAAAPPTVHGPLGFAVAAYAAAVQRFPQLTDAGTTIEIASHLGDRRGTKVGLGSSAAVTVGILAAMFAAARRTASEDQAFNRNELFATALQAHRSAQNGIGSGADIAASIYGGLILFEPRAELLPQVTPLTLPASALLLAAWSGEAAATVDLVTRYGSASNGMAARRRAFVDASRACVDDFVRGLAAGTLPLAAVNANGAALERLSHELHVPLLTPRLVDLIAIAHAHGAAAKISGAGGGDCGIALTDDAAAAQRIRAAWQGAGLTLLDLGISQKGVTVARC